MNIVVDPVQLNRILKSIDPEQAKKLTQTLLKDATTKGRAIARQNLAGGFGKAQISVRSDVEPLMAKVFSVMPEHRAMSIEVGRPPGEEPPFLQIARWTLGRYYLTKKRLPTLTRQERAQVNAAQQAIKASGVKGKHFIEAAREAVRRDIPRLLDKMAKKIEGGFGK